MRIAVLPFLLCLAVSLSAQDLVSSPVRAEDSALRIHIAEKATVAWFSTDSGRTWDNKLVLDKPRYLGSYAYTDSIGAGIGRFWVFTSSPQSEGKGDIIGVLLELAPPDTQ